MIPGGSKLKSDDLRKLAQAPSFDEFVNMLKEYPYWEDLAEAVEKLPGDQIAERGGDRSYRGLIGYADKISHLTRCRSRRSWAMPQ